MSAEFELHHEPHAKAVFFYRVFPVAIAVVLLAGGIACLVAALTQNLDTPRELKAWLFAGAAPFGVGYALIRAWGSWPLGGPVAPIRLDASGAAILKGHPRDDVWFTVPWSAVEAVTFAPLVLPAGADESLRRLRALRFEPTEGASFLAVRTWDADIRGLLDWVRSERPGLRVEDSVPRT